MSTETIEYSTGLTPAQEGMLFQHLSAERPGVDVQQILLRPPHGRLALDAFREAWEGLLERHDALRSSFRWADDREPRRLVHGTLPLPLEVEDRDVGPEAERTQQMERRLEAIRRAGFELDRPPLFRLDLVRFAEDDVRCVWTFHHTIMDGRSCGLLLEELFEAYDARREGREPAPPERPDHRRFVDWIDRREEAGDEAFWRELLTGFEAPTPLPLSGDEPLGIAATDGSWTVLPGEAELRLPADVTDRLRATAGEVGVSLGTLIRGAWALLLARHAGEDDVVFGEVRAGRAGTVPEAREMVGVCINTVPVRARVDEDRRLGGWLTELRRDGLDAREHEHAPLADVQGWSDVRSPNRLFETLLLYDHETLESSLSRPEGDGAEWRVRIVEDTGYPLTLYAYGEERLLLRLAYEKDRCGEEEAERLLRRTGRLLEEMAGASEATLRELDMLSTADRERLLDLGRGPSREVPAARLERLFEGRAAAVPDRVAVTAGSETLTYRELDERANRLAHGLRQSGVDAGTVVGLCLERSADLVTGLLAVHKAGGAYLPLDPDHPPDRLEYVIGDAGASVVLTSAELAGELPDGAGQRLLLEDALAAAASTAEPPEPRPDDPGALAYVIYTSGSTGRPKGVMVEHANVVSFFEAMDERIPDADGEDGGPPGTWLAVTSLAFDISVLELYWTLTRGYRVVLLPEDPIRALPDAGSLPRRQDVTGDVGFSLFFFGGDASARGERYGLLLEAARFADRAGFEAVWTPERHFHEFGAPYPNPSVTGAALAAATERIGIRAGSVVLPLHDPVRVAEEWSVVDAVSGGRAGVAFASGWQPEDFVLAPDRYDDRRETMMKGIETVRALWRGEEITRPGPDGEPVTFRIFPAPEGGEPSLWLTAAGNPETFRRAGTIGANVLTHLLGQDLDELERKLAVYREARAEAGHDPEAGRVTVMLHTHLGRDAEEVRSRVRGPFRDYLASSVSLLQKAAETWRGFRADGTQTAEAEGDEFESLSEEDREALLEHAFDRYYDTSGLFGTPDACAPLVERLVDAGVDEIACLVDFGVEAEAVLEGLEPLGELRSRFAGIPDAEETSLPAMIERHGVTHLQCTPSLLRLLWSDAGTRSALDDLEVLLVGGEAFPDALASEVRASLDARILNMYGPTETTVWSTTHEVRDVRGPLPIGRPIANTRTYVLDDRRRLLPRGTAGELWIGGPGVARGYRDRPELTAERFVADPFADAPEARIYRTGDRVRWRDDDALAFLGRVDRQVKVRGHRVELGEIEAVLERQDGVRAAAVLLAGDDDPRLVAYVSWRDGRPADPDRTLRAKLREVLPEHMVPARVVSLESMPLTPNRKIDRRALAGSEEASVPREAGGREQTGPADVPRERSDPGRRPPSTPVETRLARIWSETLQLDEVGPEENFFELGGNSLSTIQLARRIRDAFGVELPLRAVFRSPTVRGLAARIEEEIVAGADEDDLGALLDEVGELSDEEARRLLADRGRASGAEGREDG